MCSGKNRERLVRAVVIKGVFEGLTGLRQSNLFQRFLGGAGWSLVGSVLTQAITLLTMLLLVRILGKESYGRFVLLQTTLNMIGIFAGFGVGVTATRYVAALKGKETQRLIRILALNDRTVLCFGLMASFTLFWFAPQLSAEILNTPSLSSALAVASGAVLFSALDGYQKSILIGFEEMRAFAYGSVLGVTLGAPIFLILAGKLGLLGAALGLISTAVIQSGISRYQVCRVFARSNIRMNYRGCLEEWRVIRDFSIPALLAGAVVVPAHWTCQVMLTNTPNGYVHIALLGIAMQWFNAIMFLPAVAGRVVLPMLTEAVVGGNYSDSRRLLVFATWANLLVALPVAICIVALSPWLIWLYGQEFDHGEVVLSVAVLSATIAAVVAAVGHMLAARSRMWLGMSMNLGWALTYVGVGVLFLDYGAVGVISAMCLAYTFHAVWSTRWAFAQFKHALLPPELS